MAETKKLIPKRRFKEFQNAEDWEQCKLDDFGKSTGGTSIEAEFCKEGNYKVISIGSYSEDSKYNDQGIRAVLTSKTESRVLNRGDLTMILNDKTASGRIIGRVLLIENSGTYVYNQRTERIEVNNEDYDSNYLFQMLNAPLIRDKIVKQSQGNTQIYVNWSMIKESKYLVPKLEEQKRIGAYFDELDNLITLHQHKLEKIKSMKKAYLNEMFPAEGENRPKRRFKGFTDAWEQCKLEDISEIIGGGTPSTSNNDYWDGNIDWYAPAEIDEQIYASGSKRKITELGLKNSSAKIFPPHKTILFTSRAGIGKTAILSQPGATNQGFQSMILKDEYIPYFIYSMSNQIKEKAEAIASGSTFLEISGKMLGKLEIMVPKKTEQDIIAQLFERMDNLITLHQHKLDKLKNLKKAYLNEMFI
jgi:type I restriction enzyme S subunit